MPNEEFEKLMREKNPAGYLARADNGEYTVPGIQKKWEGYQLRQPEIDALIHDNDEMRKSIIEYDKENAELKASLEGCESANEYNKAVIRRIGELNDALKAEVEMLRADAELNRQRYLHEVYRTK